MPSSSAAVEAEVVVLLREVRSKELPMLMPKALIDAVCAMMPGDAALLPLPLSLAEGVVSVVLLYLARWSEGMESLVLLSLATRAEGVALLPLPELAPSLTPRPSLLRRALFFALLRFLRDWRCGRVPATRPSTQNLHASGSLTCM